MSDPVYDMRVRIAELGRLLFDRRLTDSAGGNVSARIGDRVCITPRYSGSKYLWRLRPEQVIVSDLQGNVLDGEGEISREAKVHFRLYRDFPEGNAVVHAHPRNVLVFASASHPIEPVLEDTLKFGTIQVTQFAPVHSDRLADFVSEKIRGQEARIRTQAAAVIAPGHGIFAIGNSLEAAYDAVERIDGNAYCILFSQLLPGFGQLSPEEIRGKLDQAVRQFR